MQTFSRSHHRGIIHLWWHLCYWTCSNLWLLQLSNIILYVMKNCLLNIRWMTKVLPSDKIARLKDLFHGSWVRHLFRTSAWLSQDALRIACGRECVRVRGSSCVLVCICYIGEHFILCKWMFPQLKKTKKLNVSDKTTYHSVWRSVSMPP